MPQEAYRYSSAGPKLRGIGIHTIEPRGPFTLASAARFIAGWPPGQAHATDVLAPETFAGHLLAFLNH